MATDITTLGVGVDSSAAAAGAKKAVDAMKSITAGASVAAASTVALGKAFKVLGTTLIKFKGIAIALFGALGVFTLLKTLISPLREFETALIGVGKTADLVGEELNLFGDAIINLSTVIPVTASDLADIAKAAGQLGITGTENLLLFTETIARLGVATNLSGEQAAIALARLLNVTGEAINTVGTLGSVITALGNKFATSEAEIAETALKIAQAGAAFKITSTEAAVLATSLSAIGVPAQRAATSIFTVLKVMTDAVDTGGAKLRQFAEVAGLSSEAFKEAFGEDKIATFITFLGGLERVDKAGGSITTTLNKLGLAEKRLQQTIPPLALKFEELGRAMGVAGAEVKNATALITESDRAFESLDSQIIIFGNVIDSVSTKLQRQLLPALKFAVEFATDLTIAFFNLEVPGRSVGAVMKTLGFAFRTMTIAAGIFASIKLGIFIVGLIGGFKGLTIAIKAFTAALARNPIGIFAVGAAIAISTLIQFKDELIKVGEFSFSLSDLFSVFWEDFIDGGKIMIEIFKEVFNTLSISPLGELFDIMTSGLETFVNALIKGGQILKLVFLEILKSLEKIIDVVSKLDFKKFLLGDLSQLDGLKDAIKPSAQFFKDLEDINRSDPLGGLKDAFSEVGSDILNNILNLKILDNILARADSRRRKREGAGVNPIQGDAPIDLTTLPQFPSVLPEESEFDKFLNAAKDAWGEYAKIAMDTTTQTKNFFADAFKGLEDTLTDFVLTGKLSFKDLADDMLANLARIGVQKTIAGIGGALFGGDASPTGGGGLLSSLFSGLFASAKGNVFDNGRPQAFAKGGIVNSPVIFPFASGTGLMGEAGPEAILPLSRGANGNLGVQVTGGGMGGGVINNITVVNQSSGTETEVEETQNASGGADIRIMIIDEVAKDIQRNGRVSRSIQSTFGAKRSSKG